MDVPGTLCLHGRFERDLSSFCTIRLAPLLVGVFERVLQRVVEILPILLWGGCFNPLADWGLLLPP